MGIQHVVAERKKLQFCGGGERQGGATAPETSKGEEGQ